jgi:hypothetical protein
MAVNLSPVFGVAGQLFDNNGNPLAGGKIFTYLAGTTTPATTYTSASGLIAHSNPIILDGAGRVPSGEIWLTDGITYKFVVQDSANNLIGTYDNLTGINSNFVAFTNQQEIQTATAGQTVFNLATMQYQPGTNSLSVFVDGVNQYGPGAQYAFVETDQDTVTFVSGLHVGASVKFTTSQLNSSGAVDASQVSYNPPFVGSVATNVEDKLAQSVSVFDFGVDSGSTPTQKTAALLLAVAASNQVFVNSGVYDPVEITASNKVLVMDANVEFKIPDGEVVSVDVTGPAAFHISGDNVIVQGSFTANGNKANNDSYSFPTSNRKGLVYVTGDNAKFFGEVFIKDAYWLGFTAEGGSTAGTEIEGLYVQRLRIDQADYHSVMIWSVTEWRIDQILATGGTTGSWLYGTKDQRIRLGTQLSNTSKCRNGSVGFINSDKYITLTVENGADNISVESALTGAGGKIQNVNQVAIQTWIAWDASLKNQAYGLAVIDASKVYIGTAMVADYDCDNSFTGYAFAIDGAVDTTIGAIAVNGSLATAAQSRDMIITGAQNVYIGQITLTNSVGTIEGFQFDYDPSYAPQENIVIGSLISTGHTTWDVSVDNSDPIRIQYVNPNAVFESLSKANVYPRINVLVDGITAPSVATSLAQIYVDGLDGDLKIIFSDGTVKTIVTD